MYSLKQRTWEIKEGRENNKQRRLKEGRREGREGRDGGGGDETLPVRASENVSRLRWLRAGSHEPSEAKIDAVASLVAP